MANFTDVTVSGLLTAFEGRMLVTANGLIVQRPATEHAILGAGPTNDLVLPGFNGQGAMAFTLTSSADATISGIDTTDLSLEHTTGYQAILLFNGNALGGHTIATSANTGSAVGNRFSAAVTIHPQEGCWFLYNGTFFCPMFPQST